jgi:hypoxia up-regulated 1
VRRTKEILSANTAAPLNVEELHGGVDFAASIQRAEFEKLAGDFFARAAVSVCVRRGSACHAYDP